MLVFYLANPPKLFIGRVCLCLIYGAWLGFNELNGDKNPELAGPLSCSLGFTIILSWKAGPLLKIVYFPGEDERLSENNTELGTVVLGLIFASDACKKDIFIN